MAKAGNARFVQRDIVRMDDSRDRGVGRGAMQRGEGVGQHRLARERPILLGRAASGALAAGSLSGAGTANATCASISGLQSGGGCTTKNFGDVAVGLGTNA